MTNIIILLQGNRVPNIATLLKVDLNNPTKWSLTVGRERVHWEQVG